MRIRYMYMRHYGISAERNTELRKLAQQDEHYDLLERAANEANAYLASYILDNLTSGGRHGYRTLFRYAAILPCANDDFYAYVRRTLAFFDLLLQGKEPIITQISAESR